MIGLKRRSGQNEEEEHEWPFYVLDFMEWALMMLGEIDNGGPRDHPGKEEGHLKPDGKTGAQEHQSQGLTLHGFSRSQSSRQVGSGHA